MINKKDVKSILDGILKYVDDIIQIVNENNVDKKKYLTSILFRHSLHMCLFQIGEISKLVPDDFKAKHTNIPWAEMKGLRNVEAHDYDNLDLNAIWETIKNDIPALKEKLQQILF